MPVKKENTDIAAKDALEKLVKAIPGLELKGATMPYTSVNGNMFSFVSKKGVIGLRLPAESREEFMKKHCTALMEAHGTIMKEYVRVPGELLHDTKELTKYMKLSYAYAQALKAKPTKKK